MPSIKQTLKARVQEQRKVLAQMRRDQSHPQSYRSEVIHSHQGHGGDHCRHDSLMDYKHEQSDHDVLYGNDRTHSGQTDIDRVGLKHPGNNDHDDGNNNGDDTDSGDDKSDSNSDDEDEDEDSVDDSILIMRVTMDHGVEEIKVPKNPNPAQLAFDFCQKHGLSPNKIALMESYIVQNINVVEDSTPSDDDPSDSDGDDTSDDNDSKGLDSQVDDHEMYRGGDKYEEGDAAIERHQLHQLGLLASAGESSSSAHGIDSTNTNSIMRNNFLTNAGQDDENSGDRDHYLATETRVFDDDRDSDEDEEDEHETRVLFPRDRLAWTSPSKREIKMMVRRSEAISKAFQELRVVRCPGLCVQLLTQTQTQAQTQTECQRHALAHIRKHADTLTMHAFLLSYIYISLQVSFAYPLT